MKVLKWLDKHFEETLIAAIICIISCLMMAQIVMRSMFTSSIPWSDETCRYLFIWAAALGIPYATTKSAHLRMDILPNLIKPLEKPFAVLCDAALLGIAIYLLIPGYGVLVQLAETGQKAASTGVPMYCVYGSMWVGFALTVIRLAEKYIKILVNAMKKKEEK